MVTVKETKQATNHHGELKSWNNKPIYEVTLTDGISGESFNNIPVGTPISDLDIQDGQYGKKIKLIKQNGFAGRQQQRAGNESFSMAYAKDLVVADKVKIDQLIPTAEKIYAWLESKKQK